MTVAVARLRTRPRELERRATGTRFTATLASDARMAPTPATETEIEEADEDSDQGKADERAAHSEHRAERPQKGHKAECLQPGVFAPPLAFEADQESDQKRQQQPAKAFEPQPDVGRCAGRRSTQVGAVLAPPWRRGSMPRRSARSRCRIRGIARPMGGRALHGFRCPPPSRSTDHCGVPFAAREGPKCQVGQSYDRLIR